MAETFDLIEEKNIALVLRKLGERALQRHAKSRMRSRRAGLMTRLFLGIVVRDFFLAYPAAPRVVAGVDQDPVGPGDEARLAAKAGDAALHFQERLLHGIFRVDGIPKNIPRQVFHARTSNRVGPF